MTTTVFLVRHGSHDRLGKMLCGRMDGVSLSEQGRGEAEKLAQRLRGQGLGAIYSSPLSRTRETADPIAAAADLPVSVDADLLEIDFGDWTGKTFDALEGDHGWSVWNTARAVARPPGGESMSEVQARLSRWLDHARRRHPDESIAAVSHADVIKALVAQVLGFSLDQHDRIEISPGSLSVLVSGDWGSKILSLNEVPQ